MLVDSSPAIWDNLDLISALKIRSRKIITAVNIKEMPKIICMFFIFILLDAVIATKIANSIPVLGSITSAVLAGLIDQKIEQKIKPHAAQNKIKL